jgi:hypothetical protein
LPDPTVDLIYSPSPLVSTLLFHPQNQRRHGIAVQIESILEPNPALVCPYPNTHFFGQIDQFQDHWRASRWWRASQTNGQVHLGWKDVADEILLTSNFDAIKQTLKKQYGSRPGATQEFNALHDLLDAPSQHIWVTFEDGCMWWCTVRDGITINPDGESSEKGHFWLSCDRRWSKTSVKGKHLVMSALPGTVTVTAGFRATVCKPRGWDLMPRLMLGLGKWVESRLA